MTTALITGASSGIGYALANLLAQSGHDVVLVARSQAELERLAQELEQQYSVRTTVIVSDLADPNAPQVIFDALQQRSMRVDVLVNNAGFGTFGPFVETDVSRQQDLIQVNVAALTHLTRLFLPAMLEQGSGRILNVASTAAFQPGPLMAVYFASKAFVLSLTEALGNELKGTGITVTALCPGATETKFQQAAHMEKSKLFQGAVMDVQTVARAGYFGMMEGKTLVIPGLRNRLGATLVRFAPRRLVPALVRRIQEES